MAPWLVGLNIGATSCKALVMAPDGQEVAWGRAPTPWTTDYPRPAMLEPSAARSASVSR